MPPRSCSPNESALGKTVYTGRTTRSRIVGIIDHMHGSWPGWDKVGNVALFPVISDERTPATWCAPSRASATR
jgi:hypothetical protein